MHQPQNPFAFRGRTAACLSIALGLAVSSIVLAGPQAAPGQRGAAAAQAAPAAPATLDAILKELATWDGGIESGAAWKLRAWVEAHKDDATGRAECETKLLAFMKVPTTTAAARMVASRVLRPFAGDSAVPALQAMLADDRTFDPALYVLQQMPGPAPEKALLTLLTTARGGARTEIIAALGERRDPEAVAALAPLLGQPDVAGAAVRALGTIGGTRATDALLAAYAGAAPALKTVIAGAAMRGAEQAVAAKRADEATKVYETFANDASLPPPVREAAAIGRMTAAGSRAGAMVMEYLRGQDQDLQEAAITRLTDAVPTSGIAPVCDLLPRLPASSQIKLLAALSKYPKESVLPTVRKAAASDDAAVRLAALKTLEVVGDDTVVAFLVDTAARAKGPDLAAARTSLGSLKGDKVDSTLLSMLSQKPEAGVESELLLAVADRRIFPAKNTVAAALNSPSSRVRIQALRALRTLGTPSDVPAVLDRLLATDDDSERTEAEAATVALSGKYVTTENRARSITTRLQSEQSPEAKARLLGVLALVGDGRALPAIRAAVAGDDAAVREAAVRAISAWPNVSAFEDVSRLARDLREETQRLLAIRGMIRLAALDKYRLPSAVVADLQVAASYCWRVEEQRLVLGALGDFACPEALQLATGFLQAPGLAKEAKAAVDRLSMRQKMGGQ
jgi:hypothetical protein